MGLLMATPLEVSVRYDAGGGAGGGDVAGGDVAGGGAVPVVVAVGEIDMSNAGRFSEALKEAAGAAEAAESAGGSGAGVAGAAGSSGGGSGEGDGSAGGLEGLSGGTPGTFVVDLSRVEYLDSAGINALFEYLSRIRLIAPPLLMPVLTVAGLGDVTTVRESSG
jgi:anti-sigma B factor antagonist